MGCDIHCYVEYRKPGENFLDGRWRDFGGKINPGRNYDLFARLAGVRNYDHVTPVAEPRGVPINMGFAAHDDWWLFVTEEKGDGYCTPANAARWAASGRKTMPSTEREIGRVEHPDWHSATWLTSDEWAQAIEGHDRHPEYKAMLAAMRSLESTGHEARVVLWFDN